jgi:hypothetical protein
VVEQVNDFVLGLLIWRWVIISYRGRRRGSGSRYDETSFAAEQVLEFLHHVVLSALRSDWNATVEDFCPDGTFVPHV